MPVSGETPTAFIQQGPYKFTRNPMYVAGALMTLGIAVAVGSLPFYLAWIVMFLVRNTIHIPFEEANLEKQFGESYRGCKFRVRRWI